MMMKNKIFIDTSAFISLGDKDDRDHINISSLFNKITKQGADLITTGYIYAETINLIKRKKNSYFAIKMGDLIRESEIVEVYSPGNADKELAWNIFKKYSDQDFSYTDCVSFAVIQNLKIEQALTLDKDFEIFGIKIIG